MTDAEIQEVAESGQLEESVTPITQRMWTHVPFVVLGAAWAGFTGALTYLLWTTAPTAPVSSPLYAYLIFGGAALALIGFVTGLVVWLLARRRASDDVRDVTRRAIWLRAVYWTAGGVALWWIGLVALDLHRAGIIG